MLGRQAQRVAAREACVAVEAANAAAAVAASAAALEEAIIVASGGVNTELTDHEVVPVEKVFPNQRKIPHWIPRQNH